MRLKSMATLLFLLLYVGATNIRGVSSSLNQTCITGAAFTQQCAINEPTEMFLSCADVPLEPDVPQVLHLKGLISAALDIHSFMSSSASDVPLPLLDLSGGASLEDEDRVIRVWLDIRLNPLISTVSRNFLTCLSLRNLSCSGYQTVVREVSQHFSALDPERQKWIYSSFMFPFLSRNSSSGCVDSNQSSEVWLLNNFGSFSVMATVQDFTSINLMFSGLEVLHLLSPEQKAELLLHPEVMNLNDSSLSLVFHSLMTSLMPDYSSTDFLSPKEPLSKALNSFLMAFKPVGGFVRDFVSLAQQPDLSSMRSATLVQAMMNLTLSHIAEPYKQNSVQDTQMDLVLFDPSDVDDWFDHVVSPLLRQFLPQDQIGIPSNLTAVFHNQYYIETGMNSGSQNESQDMCSVVIDDRTCPLVDLLEHVVTVLHCAELSNLSLSEETLQDLLLLLSQNLASLLDQLSMTNSSFSDVLNDDHMPESHLQDESFIRLWFQVKLKPLLPTLTPQYLTCLSYKNFSCHTFQILVSELSDNMALMAEGPQDVYEYFIVPFLTHQNMSGGCPAVNSSLWISLNLAGFSQFAGLSEIYMLDQNFNALDALGFLTQLQTAELIVEQFEGLPPKSVIIEEVFNYILVSPGERHLLLMLDSLIILAEQMGLDCSSYQQIVMILLEAVVPSGMKSIEMIIDQLEAIAPPSCFSPTFPCASTPVNETSLCAGMNSSSVLFNASCALGLQQLSCSALTGFTARSLAEELTCGLVNSNDSSIQIWKLLFMKTTAVLDQALVIFSNMTGYMPQPIVPAVASEVLDVISEMRLDSVTSNQWRNLTFISQYFGGVLRPFLPFMSPSFLYCLSFRNLSCQTFQFLLTELPVSKPSQVIGMFIVPFLTSNTTDYGCVLSYNSSTWLLNNFGPFGAFVSLSELISINSHFDPLEALAVLSPDQMVELMLEDLPGLPSKDLLISAVFDFLLQSPMEQGLADVLQGIYFFSENTQLSCETEQLLFTQLERLLSSSVGNLEPVVWASVNNLSLSAPPGCLLISEVPECPITSINETQVCAGVDSSGLQSFLDESNITGIPCIYSISEYACVPVLSLTTEQLLLVMDCLNSSNVRGSAESWKLFLTKVSILLDEVLLELSDASVWWSSSSAAVVLDALREIRLDHLPDSGVALWLSEHLRPFLPYASDTFLQCMSVRNYSCSDQQLVVEAFSAAFQHMSDVQQQLTVTEFILPAYLSIISRTSGVGCVSNNSSLWLLSNFGEFSGLVSLKELVSINPQFQPLEVLDLLSEEQLVELLLGDVPGLPSRDVVVSAVFQLLAVSPEQRIILTLQLLLENTGTSNISCSGFQQLVEEFSAAFQHMNNVQQQLTVTEFILPAYLSIISRTSGVGCVSNNSSLWLLSNFGEFSGLVSLKELASINPQFQPLEVLDLLSEEQLVELLLGDVPGLPSRDVVVSAVFQLLAVSPEQRIILTFQLLLENTGTSNISCSGFQQLVEEFSAAFQHMNNVQQQLTVTEFILPAYLSIISRTSGVGCVSNNSSLWLLSNFGEFSGLVTLKELVSINPQFQPLEVLDLLSEEQLVELLLGDVPGLPSRDVVVSTVFQLLAVSPEQRIILTLQLLLENTGTSNISCSGFQQLVEEFSAAFQHMSNVQQQLTVTEFILPAYLSIISRTSGVGCVSNNSSLWLLSNFGEFSGLVSLKELVSINPQFQPLEVLDLLSEEQLVELLLGDVPGLPSRDVVVSAVFQLLAVSPEQRIILTLQLLLENTGTSNISCSGFQQLVEEFSAAFQHMSNIQQQLTVTEFILPAYLSIISRTSGVGCVSNNSSLWLLSNFGEFSGLVSLKELASINPQFQPLEVLDLLSEEQLVELLLGDVPGLPSRDVVVSAVFQLLAVSPEQRIILTLQLLLENTGTSNISCSGFQQLIHRLDHLILLVSLDLEPLILRSEAVLMEQMPRGCVGYIGGCDVTPVNETALCTGVNSSTVSMYLGLSPSSRHLCDFSFTQDACADLSEMTPDDLVTLITCILNNNVNANASESLWKLFTQKANPVLGLALDQLTNMTLNNSNLAASFLNEIGEVTLNSFSSASLSDPSFVQLWFSERLRPFLPFSSESFLSCLSTRSFSCSSYSIVVNSFDQSFDLMSVITQENVYVDFIHVFLSLNTTGGCVINSQNSSDWLVENFGSFSVFSSIQDLETLNPHFNVLDTLGLLTLSQLVEVSMSPSVLFSASAVDQVLLYVPDSHFTQFYTILAGMLQVDGTVLPPPVQEEFLQQVFVRANLTTVSNQELQTWIVEILPPLVKNMTVQQVALYFSVIDQRPCGISHQGVQLLNNSISTFQPKTQDMIYQQILSTLTGPSALHCYNNQSFYSFLSSTFMSFQFPNLTTFLNLMPPALVPELMGSLSPADVSSLLNRPNTVDEPTKLHQFLSLYPQTQQYMEMEPLGSVALAQQVLSYAWPLVLQLKSPSEVDQWFDHALVHYLPLLSSQLISPAELSGASCQSFSKFVSVMSTYNYGLLEFSQRDVYRTIQAYLNTTSAPKCYNTSDPALNSTAWFVQYINFFLSFITLDDLNNFGSTELEPFTTNLQNLQLFEEVVVPDDVSQFYMTLLYNQDPTFSAFYLPVMFRCLAPVAAFLQLTLEQLTIVSTSVNLNCTNVQPAVEAALAGGVNTLTVNAIVALGQSCSDLSTAQINGAGAKVLLNALYWLKVVQNWKQDQAMMIIQTLISSGLYQINSAASLQNLGTLIIGIPSKLIRSISGLELRDAVVSQQFQTNILTAPTLIQQTIVQQVITVNTTSDAVIANVPDTLATSIPRNYLLGLSSTSSVATTLNQKSWKREQAVFLFENVATAFTNSDSISFQVLQGFTSTRIQAFSTSKIMSLIHGCRPRGNTTVSLQESQLTCMYQYIRKDNVSAFSQFPPEVLIYYDYSLVGPSLCQSYFSTLGTADFSVVTSMLSFKIPTLFANARNCLGISGFSITRQQLIILGRFCCQLSANYIINSDAFVLEQLKQCSSLSAQQASAIETVFMGGNTIYGPVSSWNSTTLFSLGNLPLYFSNNIWSQMSQTNKMAFLVTFVRQLRATNVVSKQQIMYMIYQLTISTRIKRSAGDACSVGQITQVQIYGDLFPFAYDVGQFNVCLSVQTLTDNLQGITDQVYDSSFQRVILDKLAQAYPSGLPDAVLQVLGLTSRVATPFDIVTWNVTQIDTLTALMDPSNGPWDPELVDMIVSAYLSVDGNTLGTSELNALGGSNLCALNESVLSSITAASIQQALSLSLANCSWSQMTVLFNIAQSAFSGTNTRSTSTVSASTYQMLQSFLGGANSTFVRSLVNSNINMDVITFMTMNQNVIDGLSVSDVRSLLGVNLPDLATYESTAAVQEWIRLQFQSDLDTLQIGLTGGRNATVTAVPTITNATAVQNTNATANSTSTGAGQRVCASIHLQLLLMAGTIMAMQLM